MDFNAHIGNIANWAFKFKKKKKLFFDRDYVKWAKHQTTVRFERKPYFLLQLGDTYMLRLCYSNQDKKMQQRRHSFLFSVSLSLEWLQWRDWSYLDFISL